MIRSLGYTGLALLLLCLVADAQTLQNSSGGGAVTSGTTMTSGCVSGSYLSSVSGVVSCDGGLLETASAVKTDSTHQIQGSVKGISSAAANSNMAYQLGGAGTNFFGLAATTNDASCLGYNSGGSGAGSVTCNLTWSDLVGVTVNPGIIAGGSPPTGTAGSCVVGLPQVGGQMAGTFVAGVCAGGTFILGFANPAPTGYSCDAEDRTTTTNTVQATSTTAQGVTFKATTTSGDVIQFKCMGY